MLIYLVRHALADYNSATPYHTAPGPPLTELGKQQAEATARLLDYSQITGVVSSPLRRCTQTAEPVCDRFGLQLRLDDDLGEMQPGESPAAMGLRMIRSVLAHTDTCAVALVSHAAPLEQLVLALTRDRVVFPAPDARGCRIKVGEVWQLVRRDGEWSAQHLPAGGVLV